jgi:hypothetical protein
MPLPLRDCACDGASEVFAILRPGWPWCEHCAPGRYILEARSYGSFCSSMLFFVVVLGYCVSSCASLLFFGPAFRCHLPR